MVALAARMGPRSGRLLRSIGVGTVTMNTVHAASSAGSAVKLSRSARRSSSSLTSRVSSRPACSAAMRDGLMSKPSTGRCALKATASGRPT